MNKVIALDIGEVCVNLRYDLCMERLELIEETVIPEEFLDATEKLECGKFSEQQWLDVFMKVTDNKFSKQELVDTWNLIIGPPKEGMHDALIDIINLGFRFVFFSDTSEGHILHTCQSLPFANLISGAIYSYEVGVKKPAPGMYEAFEEKFGIPFFYIDDKSENIKAAQERGWQSHQFTTSEKFKKEFYKALDRSKL